MEYFISDKNLKVLKTLHDNLEKGLVSKKSAEPPTLFAVEDLREIERAERLRGERRAILENGRKGKKHA